MSLENVKRDLADLIEEGMSDREDAEDCAEQFVAGIERHERERILAIMRAQADKQEREGRNGAVLRLLADKIAAGEEGVV